MKKIVIGAVAVVVLVAAWAVFRPELLFVNQRVNESLPEASAAGGARVLAEGSFHDGAHMTRGKAAVLELSGGKRILRLTQFETSNGPDVQVYLGQAADAQDNETVTRAGFQPLGSLKGNTGDQNYELPAGLDLSRYHSVTIWCRRFGVNFGTAPLMDRG